MSTDPFTVLGVSREAGEEEFRRAWLEAVRRHPPERDPEGFRRVRRAYDLVRDPWRRARERLFGRDDLADLTDLARLFSARRRPAGPEPWLAVVRERPR